MGSIDVSRVVEELTSERIFPFERPQEHAVALSLIDATTVDFSTSCAIWLCETPDQQETDFNLFNHFRQSLQITLNAYPQWTGHLKSIHSVDPADVRSEAAHFEPHARRYGRVYAHYGTSSDPGVEFVTAESPFTLETLSPASRTTEHPIYDRQEISLKDFVPSVVAVNAVREKDPSTPGLLPPIMAVQVTQLACGGFALSVKVGHPLADITSVVTFVKDWASISRWILSGSKQPTPILDPVFEPDQLDSMAAGDINAETPDPAILKQVASLPLNRYDWWISTAECPWRPLIPPEYRDKEIQPIGDSMPWSEWDSVSPVSHYLIHLTHAQVESLWKDAVKGSPHESGAIRISRHDAILAHMMSCIARARNQNEDTGPLHCDLTIGLRPALHLETNFIGSPSMIVNVEMSGVQLASSKIPAQERIRTIAHNIRKTIDQMTRPAVVGAHLHKLSYETSPQRIWQAFLGSRHLLVTSWARAGIYDIDFGLSASPIIRFAEGVVADLDGCAVIKEAPPGKDNGDLGGSWTDHGVDVSLHLRAEDMERLIEDPLLLP
ncbi:transferase family protein [Penicillium angulare]|uniref:transferase family protein n=1 Tax=Penicillium angulare TaxID=116970 RepID=UPI002540EE24|nr:transferase family protein [Penicillium angulare]KAJ5273161.1 transferase family protein [Penicillium angulare]